MAHVVIVGAGLGGMPMTCEAKEQLLADDRVAVVGNGPNFRFVRSNPRGAVNRPKRVDIHFPAAPHLARKGIAFDPRGAKRVRPADNPLELNDGTRVPYDFLVVASGPKLAFDGIEGLGPNGHAQSVCHVDHAEREGRERNAFVADPGPIVEAAPLPAGSPRTGSMIESMVTATAHDIREVIDGKAPTGRATWKTVCLADMGDTGIASVAPPQIPPRNVNRSSEGQRVRLAKNGFGKYFMRKMKEGTPEPFYEKSVMNMIGITECEPRR